MKWILTTAVLLLTLALVGCSSNPVLPKTQESEPAIAEMLTLAFDSSVAGDVKGASEATALGATYANGVIPWHDNIEGDDDWMAVFYLPYNPGTVYFYGRLRTGQWQPFGYPFVKYFDARWTSQGFRVMIFMGDKVTAACTTNPSSYRLQY